MQTLFVFTTLRSSLGGPWGERFDIKVKLAIWYFNKFNGKTYKSKLKSINLDAVDLLLTVLILFFFIKIESFWGAEFK